MTVFSLISIIVSILCLVWLLGLGVFVLIRAIINKVKARKEIKSYESKK